MVATIRLSSYSPRRCKATIRLVYKIRKCIPTAARNQNQQFKRQLKQSTRYGAA